MIALLARLIVVAVGCVKNNTFEAARSDWLVFLAIVHHLSQALNSSWTLAACPRSRIVLSGTFSDASVSVCSSSRSLCRLRCKLTPPSTRQVTDRRLRQWHQIVCPDPLEHWRSMQKGVAPPREHQLIADGRSHELATFIWSRNQCRAAPV